jgi:hypothetical protein
MMNRVLMHLAVLSASAISSGIVAYSPDAEAGFARAPATTCVPVTGSIAYGDGQLTATSNNTSVYCSVQDTPYNQHNHANGILIGVYNWEQGVGVEAAACVDFYLYYGGYCGASKQSNPAVATWSSISPDLSAWTGDDGANFPYLYISNIQKESNVQGWWFGTTD